MEERKGQEVGALDLDNLIEECLNGKATVKSVSEPLGWGWKHANGKVVELGRERRLPESLIRRVRDRRLYTLNMRARKLGFCCLVAYFESRNGKVADSTMAAELGISGCAPARSAGRLRDRAVKQLTQEVELHDSIVDRSICPAHGVKARKRRSRRGVRKG